MLYLFLAVSLYSTQKCLQLVLLFLTESSFFLSQFYLELNLHFINFFFLKTLTDKFYLFCIHVIFDSEINLLLFSQLDDLLVPSMIIVEFLSLEFVHVFNFLILFGFELFNEIEGSAFIVTHVFVPGIRKFLVLKTLCIFNINQLSLLCNSHVVMLSLLFILTPSIENFLELISHHVITMMLISLPHFIHDPK